MLAAIPIGPARPTTLPYVLRALRKHAGVDYLVTVGDRPAGITPDLHIDSPNTAKPHQNVAGHLCRLADELTEPFVWCDDDTFTLKSWTPGVYVRPFSIAYMLRHNPKRGYWSVAVGQSIKVMESWGYDSNVVPCGTTHRPWLVDPDRARMIVDALDAVGGGSFKALYVAGLSGLIEAEDIKLVGRGTIKPDADVVSVYHNSWNDNAGRILRETFADPTPWESAPEPVTAVRRGPRRHRR